MLHNHDVASYDIPKVFIFDLFSEHRKGLHLNTVWERRLVFDAFSEHGMGLAFDELTTALHRNIFDGRDMAWVRRLGLITLACIAKVCSVLGALHYYESCLLRWSFVSPHWIIL